MPVLYPSALCPKHAVMGRVHAHPESGLTALAGTRICLAASSGLAHHKMPCTGASAPTACCAALNNPAHQLDFMQSQWGQLWRLSTNGLLLACWRPEPSAHSEPNLTLYDRNLRKIFHADAAMSLCTYTPFGRGVSEGGRGYPPEWSPNAGPYPHQLYRCL